MIFIDKQGNYPKYLGDLQEAYPEWTFKNSIPNGWRVVTETEPPLVTGLEMLVEEYPEEVDGKLKQKWSVVKMPKKAVSVELPETSFERFTTDPKHGNMIN